MEPLEAARPTCCKGTTLRPCLDEPKKDGIHTKYFCPDCGRRFVLTRLMPTHPDGEPASWRYMMEFH